MHSPRIVRGLISDIISNVGMDMVSYTPASLPSPPFSSSRPRFPPLASTSLWLENHHPPPSNKMSHITTWITHNYSHIERSSKKRMTWLIREKYNQSSHPAPAASTAQHSRSLPYYDEGFSIIGYIETPCYDQNSQTPRHCKLSSKLASTSELYAFLTRSTGLLGPMGLSRASYRPPSGPVQSRKTDCTGVSMSLCHPHGLVTGARISTVRNTYEIR